MGNIKKNAVYNILLSASQLLFPLVTFPYVSRVLGPLGIGQVSFADSITQYFILVAALGIPVYGVREIAKVKTDSSARSRVFSELLFIHGCTTIIAFLIYVAVFFTLPAFQMHQSLFIVGSGLVLLQLFVIEWLFQGLEAFPYITKRTLLVRLASILAIFLFVKTAQDGVWYYAIFLVTLAINALFNIVYAKRFVHFRIYPNAFSKHLRPLLYIFSLGVVTSVYTVLDTALLGLLSDLEQVGYYATAMRLIKLIVLIFVAFSTVLIPPLSHAFHRQQLIEVHALLRKSFGYMVFICVPASIGLMVVAPLILPLFAGQAFRDATIILRILAPTLCFVGLSNVFGMQLLNSTNNERLFFKAAIVGMCISMGINFILIPIWGGVGSAIASLLTEGIVLLLLIRYGLGKVAFQPPWPLLLQAFLASLSFIPIYWFVAKQTFSSSIQLGIILCLSVVTYGFIQVFLFHNPYLAELVRLFKSKLGASK